MATASEERLRPVSSDGLSASIRRTLDKPLTSYHLVLGSSALLLCLGLLMVLSASSVASLAASGSSFTIFEQQATWVAIGLPLAYVASRLPHAVLGWLSWPALLGSIALLALTYVPGFGVEVNGNQNWLRVGPFQLQPSEFVKLALILWCANVYAKKRKLLHRWRHLLVPVMPVCMLVAGLVVGQRDLGTALVLFGIVLGLLWVIGAPMRLFVASALAVGALAFALAASDKERVARLVAFLHPLADYNGNGWQASHGFFALAAGGIWGRGIGASSQKWGGLPNSYTDYIFAIIGEEFGLFGTLVVLALFVTLAYAGIRIAVRTKEPFVRYTSAGIVVWLMGQAIINIGMVVGLLPVIGVPLPLISYGGSALLPTLIALGLLVSFARTEPGAAAALRARARDRQRKKARIG